MLHGCQVFQRAGPASGWLSVWPVSNIDLAIYIIKRKQAIPFSHRSVEVNIFFMPHSDFFHYTAGCKVFPVSYRMYKMNLGLNKNPVKACRKRLCYQPFGPHGFAHGIGDFRSGSLNLFRKEPTVPDKGSHWTQFSIPYILSKLRLKIQIFIIPSR
jgi:hypothetical protein